MYTTSNTKIMRLIILVIGLSDFSSLYSMRFFRDPHEYPDKPTKNLFRAIQKQSLPAMHQAINERACVTYCHKKYETPIVYAMGSGFFGAIAPLLVAGANPNDKKQNNNETLLQLSIAAHRHDIVQLLIDRGADVTLQDAGGYTAMLSAALHRNITAAHIIGNKDRTQLHKPGPHGETPLHIAAWNGDGSFAKYLLKEGAFTQVDCQNDRELTPLMNLLSKIVTNKNEVKCLIQSHRIERCMQEEIIGLLREVSKQHTKRILKLLKKHGHAEYPDELGWDTWVKIAGILREIADERILPLLQFLLERGADVNHYSSHVGMTPLHMVVHTGSPTLVSLLLSCGGNPNAMAKESGTPLHYAARAKYYDIVQFLVLHGADLNARNARRGDTPLALMGVGPIPVIETPPFLELVQTLYARRAEQPYLSTLTSRDLKCNIDCARELIQQGADVSWINDKKQSTQLGFHMANVCRQYVHRHNFLDERLRAMGFPKDFPDELKYYIETLVFPDWNPTTDHEIASHVKLFVKNNPDLLKPKETKKEVKKKGIRRFF